MRNIFDGSHWSIQWDFQADLLNVLLYLRDALQLDDAALPHVPPLLVSIGDPVHVRLSATDVKLVTGTWHRLWKLAIPLQPKSHADATDLLSVEARLLRRVTPFDQVVAEVPLLRDLASSPAVLEVLQQARDRALEWNRTRTAERIAFGRRYAHEVNAQVKSLVERLVDARQPTSDLELQASITILDSEIEWWDHLRPGVFLCTRVVAQDRNLFFNLLQETFLSVPSLEVMTGWTEEIVVPQHKLPPSALPQSVVLADNENIVLTCERVIPCRDGFEVNLKRTAKNIGTSTTLLSDRNQKPYWEKNQSSDPYNGLRLEVRLADERKELVTDLRREDRPGDPTVVRFDRHPFDRNSLWLWIMPLPPPGACVIELSWPEQGIDSAIFEFDGILLLLQ